MTQVLPSGTVSLVFSDVQGSTALLSRLGAGYAAALDGQREVLRAAWAAQGAGPIVLSVQDVIDIACLAGRP